MAAESRSGEKTASIDTTDSDAPTAAICPICLTVTTDTDPKKAHTIAENHNDNLHGGVRVARPVKPKANHIGAFRHRVERSLDERALVNVDELIAEKEPWGGFGGD